LVLCTRHLVYLRNQAPYRGKGYGPVAPWVPLPYGADVAALRQPYFDRSDALLAFQKVVRGQGLIPVTWTMDPNYYLYGGRPEGALPCLMRTDNAGR
jgi:hypothetical protein